MAITIKQIKDLLDKPASRTVSDDSIQENLDRAKRLIDNLKNSSASQDDVEDAKRALCVWLTYGSYVEGISEQLGGIALADNVKLEHFQKLAELYINQIAQSPISLSDNSVLEQPIGIDPSVFKLTTTEAYPQDG